MRRIISISLATLSLALVIIPTYATSYLLTFELYVPGKTEPLWIGEASIETENGVKNIPVPQVLYDLIVLWMGTDTFVTPFTVSLPVADLTLEVSSDPSGLTLIFIPMNPGDINGDSTVNIFDVVEVCEAYGEYDMFVDFNFDQRVDIFDVVHVADNYGNQY